MKYGQALTHVDAMRNFVTPASGFDRIKHIRELLGRGPGDIVSAELYVNAKRSTGTAPANPRFLYDSGTDWTEAGLTYANAPTGTNLALIPGASFIVNNTSFAWLNTDITHYLKQKRSEGAQKMSLAILGTNGNTNPVNGTVYTKESITVNVKSRESGSSTTPYIKIISTLTPSSGPVTMTEQFPANEAVHVPLDAILTATFENDIFKGAQFSGIQLTNNGLPVTITASTDGKVLTVTPAKPLPHGSTYQLRIPAGALNNSLGTPLEQDILSSFSTVLNHPYVVSTSPAANAYNVAVQPSIQVKFNETIQEQLFDTVTLSTYEDHQPVPATVSVSGDTLTVTPNAPLDHATSYRVVVPAQAIKSSYDMSLIEDVDFAFKTVGSPMSGTMNVESIVELEEALARAMPGSEIILKDGTYVDAKPVLLANGTAEQPIIVRSETPGGVRFTGAPGIILSGSHMIFKDFFFDRAVYKNGHSVRIVGGQYIRVTGNYFYQCGDTESAYAHIVRIEGNSSHNRVDHNTFEDSRGMSVGVKIGGEENRYNLYNTIDHNYFRNIRYVGDWFAGWTNGLESIQIGQGNNSVSSYATTNRIGNGSIFSGNFFFNGKDGIRSYGSDQIITNNYFFNVQNTPISLPSGGADNHDQSQNTKIVNNTIVYSGDASSIAVGGGTYGAVNTLIGNNVIVTNRSEAITNSPSSTQTSNNAIYAWGTGSVGNNVQNYYRGDLGLVRHGMLFRPSANSKVVDYGTTYDGLAIADDMDGQSRIGIPDAGADEVSQDDVHRMPLSILDVGPEDKWWVPADYYSMGMILWNGVPLYGFKVEIADYTVTLPGSATTPPVVEAYLWEGSKATLVIDQATGVDGKATVRVLDLDGNPMKLFPTNQDAVYTIQFVPNADQTTPVTTITPSDDMQDHWYPSGLTVEFSAQDPGGSGVSRVEYRLDGASEWSTYLGPIDVSDGIHVIEYRGIDHAGNVEDSKFSVLQVGSAAAVPSPVLQAQPAGMGSVQLKWTSVPATVTYQVYGSTVQGEAGTVIGTVDADPHGSVSTDLISYQAEQLDIGTTYYFTVLAATSSGTSFQSNVASFKPVSVPGAPTNVTATAGDRSATVSFTAPVSDGGSPVTGYEVAISPGSSVVTGTASPILVTGLSNGTTYSFTVKAINAEGESEASAASNSVTPAGQTSGDDDTDGHTGPIVMEPEVPAEEETDQPGTITTTQVGGQNVAKFIVDADKLEGQLAAFSRGSSLSIEVPGDVQVALVELNMQSIASLSNKAALIAFHTENASYSVPAEQLSADKIRELPSSSWKAVKFEPSSAACLTASMLSRATPSPSRIWRHTGPRML